MPAPILRRYSADNTNVTAATLFTVAPAVPAARALVGRLVCVNTHTAAVPTDLFVGGAAIARDIQLGPGQVYEQVGVVAVAGESIQASADTGGGTLVVTFMGEEVDN